MVKAVWQATEEGSYMTEDKAPSTPFVKLVSFWLLPSPVKQ